MSDIKLRNGFGSTSRRDLLKLPLLAGALGAFSPRAQAIDEDDPKNIKIAHILDADTSDDFLHFCQQIGLRWVRLEYNGSPDVDTIHGVQQRFGKYGMKLYAVTHGSYKSLKIQLGQPGRDQDIEVYRGFLASLGKLGIPTATYDFHPANTYTTNMIQRRGYETREFDLQDFRSKAEKQRFDREYSAEDIWSYYTYFVKAVLPVAEENNVKLALHPDDPPVSMMNGVAKLFVHYDGYKRAEEIAAGSPAWGVRLCVGTWAEGGDKMGKSVVEMIRDFGGRGKLHDVDFRNVSGPLPHFVETFPDEGYVDMYEVMKTLREVGYSGGLTPDHLPAVNGDDSDMRQRRAGLAYCIAYNKALLRRANEEVG